MKKVPSGSMVRVPKRALCDDPSCYTECLTDAMVIITGMFGTS